MVPEQEWIFWMDDGEMSRAEGRMTEHFHNNRRVFDALGRNVTRFAWGREVAPGVTAAATPGHTVGHTSFVVTSGSARVFIQGDMNNQSVVFSKHPELGATRLFGEVKPWAPSFSYGLLIEMDKTLMPVGSAQSRANGQRHAICDAAIWNGDLIAISRASGEILNLGKAA